MLPSKPIYIAVLRTNSVEDLYDVAFYRPSDDATYLMRNLTRREVEGVAEFADFMGWARGTRDDYLRETFETILKVWGIPDPR